MPILLSLPDQRAENGYKRRQHFCSYRSSSISEGLGSSYPQEVEAWGVGLVTFQSKVMIFEKILVCPIAGTSVHEEMMS